MENTNQVQVVLTFQGRESLSQIYRLQIDNLLQAVSLAAGDKSLLRQYELELMESLAHVRNLQAKGNENGR